MRRSWRQNLGLSVFTTFTLWITWQTKLFEITLAGHGGQEDALVGKQAPAFRLTTLDGHSISEADLRGKQRLVVSFWASWCQPCRTELPVLANLYQRTHLNARYEIVAISTDEEEADAEHVASKLRLPFTVLIDPRGVASRAYGVEAIPTLFLIDQDGKITHVHVGLGAISDGTLAAELGIKDFSPLSEADDAAARR